MPRETLNRQIQMMLDEILVLGSMVEQAVQKSVTALKNRDLAAARRLFDEDRIINDKRYAIENAIMILIATQAPMAHDLRLMAALLEVSTELERMGDYGKGIAKITLRLGEAELPIPIEDIQRMADLALSMLHRALTAFVNENASQASVIPAEDNAVDELYNKVYMSMVNSMIANPAIIDHANFIMWVAHNLERLADRVTNICERTVFICTGELMELDPTDEEDNE